MTSLEAADKQQLADGLRLADFELGDVLGEGSYAQVIEARRRQTNTLFALKVIDKRHVLRQNKQKYAMSEKAILSKLKHPGIVRLHATFQDHLSLYFVLELAEGGELLQKINSSGRTSDACIKFYCAEILVILEYLHSQGIIHRDLKPENLLLKDGHIKLVDFGSAKDVSDAISSRPDLERRSSFVGTAEYVPPELLNNEPVGFEADLWAFGCIIYQMYCGRPPCKGDSEYLIFQKILSYNIEYPTDLPTDAKSLIQRLLSKDPKERMGDGFQSIKSHAFFGDVEFDNLFSSPAPSWICESNSPSNKS